MEFPGPPSLAPTALPLFAHMAPEARDRLLASALVHAVPAGSVLFEQGSLPAFQFAVLAGSVHLFGQASSGKEVLIEVLGPGDLVIPAAVVTQSPFLMQARVMEPARFLLLPAGPFREAVASDPALSAAMVASLASQFRRMVRQIKNLKLRSAPERVGSYLLALMRKQGVKRVHLPYDKHLIASELGMTRESFSRTLSALQKQGIRVEGEYVSILDPTALTEAAKPDALIDPEELP